MDCSQAIQYLETLLMLAPRDRDLYIQLKAIDPAKLQRPFAWCYLFSQANSFLSAAENLNATGRHVFASVNPRFRPGGKKVDVNGVVALPFDYDTPELAQTAKEQFGILGLQPGLVVESGRGGAHLYLLLDRYELRVEEAQAVGRRLCRFTQSDPVHARSQVMRIPGGVNWKPEARGTLTQLVACDPLQRFSLEEIAHRLDAFGVPAAQPPRRHAPRPPRATGEFELALNRSDLDEEDLARQDLLFSYLPESYQHLARWGALRGERSERVFGLLRVLVNFGASEDEIETFFRLRPTGIGEVVMDKGTQWLDCSLTSLLTSTDAADPVEVSTVRLSAYYQRQSAPGRVVLKLTVEDGPFKGTRFKGGMDLRRAVDPWRFFFMAFGVPPAPLGDVNAIPRVFGMTGRAVLVRDHVGLNVKWWWPAGRA